MFEDLKEITFEITNRCDLHCKICNIWKEKNKVYLSLESVQKVLEQLDGSPSVSLTGGEPFFNPFIDKIYKYLFKLFLQKKIRNIDIATNAYSKRILEFLENNKDFLQPLSLSISLDGIGETHNKQRGKNDAFQKTIKNILNIKKKQIPITLKFVISKINYRDVLKVYELSKKLNFSLNIKFFEKVTNYYHRQNKCDCLTLAKKELPILKDLIGKIYKYENSNNKKNLSSLSLLFIRKFLKNANFNFIKKCFTPKYSLFITSYGNIYNCIYQENIGNIKNWPNFDSKKFNKILEKARQGNCPKCLSYHGFLKEFNLQ